MLSCIQEKFVYCSKVWLLFSTILVFSTNSFRRLLGYYHNFCREPNDRSQMKGRPAKLTAVGMPELEPNTLGDVTAWGLKMATVFQDI